jgi:hypothetical protein
MKDLSLTLMCFLYLKQNVLGTVRERQRERERVVTLKFDLMSMVRINYIDPETLPSESNFTRHQIVLSPVP